MQPQSSPFILFYSNSHIILPSVSYNSPLLSFAADIEVIDQQGDMEESCPKDLQDEAVLRLRASVTASRKLIVEINDQVGITNIAKG